MLPAIGLVATNDLRKSESLSTYVQEGEGRFQLFRIFSSIGASSIAQLGCLDEETILMD